MKSKHSEIKAWATKASAKLTKIAESTTPDAPVAARDKVNALRRPILALRHDYTWGMIAKMLADPEIGIEVTASTLRRLASSKRRRAA